jgi:predicted TIM-barrel fold metal-dependent hydrolase
MTGFIAIDCHAHVMRRDLPLVSNRHSAPRHDIGVDDYIATLDAHGISHGMLTAPSFYGTDNTLLLSALDAYPERLRGTVIVDPSIDAASLARMDARGARGVRLNWFRRAEIPDVTGTDYQRLFRAVKNIGWHVEIYIEGHKLAEILPVIRAAGVDVVLDHFGAPDPATGVASPGFRETLNGVRAGDTWVKLSAPFRQGGADCQAYVDALLDAGGPQQLLWASDFPFVSFEDTIRYRMCVDWIERWIPDAATRRIVLVETPRRLFRY